MPTFFLCTFGDLGVLTDAPAQGQSDIWKIVAESDRHSVPLSAAALPTDWGDWDPERPPISTQCLGTFSDSLKTVRLIIFTHWETPVLVT